MSVMMRCSRGERQGAAICSAAMAGTSYKNPSCHGNSWLVYLAGFVLTLTSIMTAVEGLECYSCVYVPGVRSTRGSCSDPWQRVREDLNFLTGPPTKKCEEGACLKIVVKNAGNYDSVVRTCGKPCNDSLSGSTFTSCCETDLCNTAASWLQQRTTLKAVLFASFTLWISLKQFTIHR